VPADTIPRLCADLADELAGADDTLLSPATRAHVERCLRCQATLAAHRRLRRALRSLTDEPVPFDPELHHRILVALDRHDGRHTRRVPGYAAATIGGLAAAAGVIAIARQRRAG
jgi:anti-sigma factor RsiW